MAARWSSENVVVEFRDAQVLLLCFAHNSRPITHVVTFPRGPRKERVQSVSEQKAFACSPPHGRSRTAA